MEKRMQVAAYTIHQTAILAAESPKPVDNQNLLMWRTEVPSMVFCVWGLHSSHHLLNTKTLTAMSYFWGTTLIICWGIWHALSCLKENIIASFRKIPPPRASLGLWIFGENEKQMLGLWNSTSRYFSHELLLFQAYHNNSIWVTPTICPLVGFKTSGKWNILIKESVCTKINAKVFLFLFLIQVIDLNWII